MLSILSLLFLVTSQPLYGSAQDSCAPNCTDVNAEGITADKEDCHNFYVCVSGEPKGPLDCPDGEYFDNNNKTCLPEGPEECEPICGGSGNGADCFFQCTDPVTNKYRIDRYDCSTYYECPTAPDTETETVHTCTPETPFFNGAKCQTDESACCHCRPYCYIGDVAGTLVVDPIDCTKYYLCTEPEMVPIYQGTCPPGDNFDILERGCSSTAPCVTLCTNVINGDGCIDVYTCEEVGYFAACPKGCDLRYYRCYDDDLGNTVPATTCPDGKVFHPDDRTCVPEEDCPYSTSRH